MPIAAGDAYRPAAAGAAAGKATSARSLSPPARLSADSWRHLLRGTKRQRYLVTTRTRWRKTRTGIAPAAFRLRRELGLAHAAADRHASPAAINTLRGGRPSLVSLSEGWCGRGIPQGWVLPRMARCRLVRFHSGNQAFGPSLVPPCVGLCRGVRQL